MKEIGSVINRIIIIENYELYHLRQIHLILNKVYFHQ